MSPEQTRGHAVDKRTDIWAFGCVVYEMLTGRIAFAGDTVSDTIAAILQREPDWRALPAGTPAPVKRLLRRCLEKDPRERLHDIGDARLELKDALTAPPEALPQPTVAPSRRERARLRPAPRSSRRRGRGDTRVGSRASPASAAPNVSRS
jgi:serine/threonine protein kinase